MNRNWNRVGMPGFRQHMVAAFHPVHAKPKSLQCSDSTLTRYGRVRGHQGNPTMRFNSASFEPARGIRLRLSSIDRM